MSRFFHQTYHAARVFADDIDEFAPGFRGVVHIKQGIGIALDGGQGGTQFVRDIGHQIALHANQAGHVADIVQHDDRAHFFLRAERDRLRAWQAEADKLCGQVTIAPAVQCRRCGMRTLRPP